MHRSFAAGIKHFHFEILENEPLDLASKRAEWFFRGRLSPQGHVPNGLRLRALRQRDEMVRQEGTFVDTTSLSRGLSAPAQWIPIGPQPLLNTTRFGSVSGRVTAIAVDPCDASGNTVYIGAADGGVWKTSNANAGGNTTWTPLTDRQPSLASGALAVINAGSNCGASTIYYGTGEESFSVESVYGAGVLTSTNAGATWSQDQTFTGNSPVNDLDGGPFIGRISVSPSNPATLLAAVEIRAGLMPTGVYRSTDGGSTWSHVGPANPSSDDATDVAFDPNDSTGQTAFAALGSIFGDAFVCSSGPCNGIFKSTDGGVTWSRMTGLDTAISASLGSSAVHDYGKIVFAVGRAGSPASTPIYAAIASTANSGFSFGLLAIAKSLDGGTTWTVLANSPGFCNFQCYYDMALAVDPANSNIVFAGGGPQASLNAGPGVESTLIRSRDGGASWEDISVDNSGAGTQLHVDHHAIAFSPDGTKVYAGNDGGVWVSTDAMSAPAGSQHWANLNGGLQITQFYSGMAAHPTDPNTIFGGTQDNGTQRFSGNVAWSDARACGDGGYNVIDASTIPFTLYSACSLVPALFKNTQAGAPGQFTDITTGIDPTESYAFLPPFAVDPESPQTIYFGKKHLWQNKNGGAANQWVVVGGVDPTVQEGDVLSVIAVAPSDSNTVYLGTLFGSAAVTTNALQGASATFTHPTGLPSGFRILTSIAVDPVTASTAYLSYSGFSSFVPPGHIFKTTDSGVTWVNIDGDLPNIPVNNLLLDPGAPTGTIYAATDIGVFITTNGGAHWQTLAPGLPNDQVLSLAFQASDRLLIAGTHGRGAWKFVLGPPAIPPDFVLGSVVSTPANATIQAGGSVTYSVPLTAQGGFTSLVTLACAGNLPVKTTCSFNPPTVTPKGIAANSVLTIATTANASASPLSIRGMKPSLLNITGLSAAIGVLLVLCHRRNRARNPQLLVGLLATLVVAFLLLGCGGGIAPKPVTFIGTPPGSYHIAISATSGTTTHQATVNLVVQ